MQSSNAGITIAGLTGSEHNMPERSRKHLTKSCRLLQPPPTLACTKKKAPMQHIKSIRLRPLQLFCKTWDSWEQRQIGKPINFQSSGFSPRREAYGSISWRHAANPRAVWQIRKHCRILQGLQDLFRFDPYNDINYYKLILTATKCNSGMVLLRCWERLYNII